MGYNFRTSSIGEVVVPEHSHPFGGFHSEVALVTVSSGVHQIHIILNQRLKHKLELSGTMSLMPSTTTR